MQIYGLYDPRDQQLRYVGKTRQTLKFRLKKHVAASSLTGHSHRENWIRSLLAQGTKPEIRLIQADIATAEALNEAERRWIAHYRDLGCDLTNTTSGGDGQQVGYIPTAETRARLSVAGKGRVFSQAHRKALSASLVGQTKTPEARQRISAALGGRPFTDSDGRLHHTIHQAARDLRMSATEICAVLKGRSKSAQGKTFAYVS